MAKNFTPTAITTLAVSCGLVYGSMVQAAEVKLHPLESYTAIYSQKGSVSGEYKEYCRNYCNERVQDENFSVQMMGINLPPQKKRTVSIGAVTKIIDFTTGKVTEINSPFYESIKAGASNLGPVESAKQFLKMTGLEPTDETATIGKWSCTIWASQALGTRICMDKNMIAIETTTDIVGMRFTRTLVKFMPGDPGPKEVYKIPEGMTVQPLSLPKNMPPNIQELLEKMMPKQN